ncbi:hypothetical protein M8J76_005829 [Diaphorina citri]|nr:hypothetical protein M8J75_004400 [Diaphorina citri]KAI5700320.1 hypothetical protein M8J76_001130 [Diaphorina citri]KAI5722247.1 hypothetical protein M8J76_005829 [Diaphorina citri]KAI5724490.1 hypothetical protein M8J77_003312 [Diaphorina citri]
MWTRCKNAPRVCKHAKKTYQLSNGIFNRSTCLTDLARAFSSKLDIDPVNEKQKKLIEDFRRSREYNEAYTRMQAKEGKSRYQQMISAIRPMNVFDTPFTLDNISVYLANTKRKMEIKSQSYNELRIEKLGHDIGAAHFVLFRRGAVKFYGMDKWLRWTTEKKYTDVEGLPGFYKEGYQIEAIDLGNVNVYYEGLKNLEPLKRMTFLSLENNPLVDDWYLDYLSNFPSLEYLNLKNCPLISHRGIAILHKLDRLQTLLLKNDKTTPSNEMKLAVLNLLEYNPGLSIDIDPSTQESIAPSSV